jgi:hypothetical protein
MEQQMDERASWYQKVLAIPDIVPITGIILILSLSILVQGVGPRWLGDCMIDIHTPPLFVCISLSSVFTLGILPIFICLSLFSRQVWTTILGWTYLVLLGLLALILWILISWAMVMGSVEGKPRIQATALTSGYNLRV